MRTVILLILMSNKFEWHIVLGQVWVSWVSVFLESKYCLHFVSDNLFKDVCLCNLPLESDSITLGSKARHVYFSFQDTSLGSSGNLSQKAQHMDKHHLVYTAFPCGCWIWGKLMQNYWYFGYNLYSFLSIYTKLTQVSLRNHILGRRDNIVKLFALQIFFIIQ